MKYILLASLFLLSGCPESETLGQSCESNANCEISWGEYCYMPGCDPDETDSFCDIKPTQLQCSYATPYLVCGCNGKEYPSTCHAAEDRQSIRNYGPCPKGDAE